VFRVREIGLRQGSGHELGRDVGVWVIVEGTAVGTEEFGLGEAGFV